MPCWGKSPPPLKFCPVAMQLLNSKLLTLLIIYGHIFNNLTLNPPNYAYSNQMGHIICIRMSRMLHAPFPPPPLEPNPPLWGEGAFPPLSRSWKLNPDSCSHVQTCTWLCQVVHDTTHFIWTIILSQLKNWLVLLLWWLWVWRCWLGSDLLTGNILITSNHLDWHCFGEKKKNGEMKMA